MRKSAFNPINAHVGAGGKSTPILFLNNTPSQGRLTTQWVPNLVDGERVLIRSRLWTPETTFQAMYGSAIDLYANVLTNGDLSVSSGGGVVNTSDAGSPRHWDSSTWFLWEHLIDLATPNTHSFWRDGVAAFEDESMSVPGLLTAGLAYPNNNNASIRLYIDFVEVYIRTGDGAFNSEPSHRWRAADLSVSTITDSGSVGGEDGLLSGTWSVVSDPS